MNYLPEFLESLKAAKPSEYLVAKEFAARNPDWAVENVGDIRKYFYKGDIKITNKNSGEVRFIEVKNDSYLPSCFLSLEWLGDFIVRGQ